MSQRLSIALFVALLLVCLGLAGVVWQAQLANRALAEQQQLLATQFVEAMARQQSSAADRTALPAEWTNVRIRFIRDAAGRQPVAGVEASLTQPSEPNQPKPPARARTSDADGLTDFGALKFGVYSVSLNVDDWTRYLTLEVHPGDTQPIEVVCPAQTTSGRVRIELDPRQTIPQEVLDHLWLTIRLESVAVGDWRRSASLFVTRRPDGRCCVWSDDDVMQSLSDALNATRAIQVVSEGIDSTQRATDLAVRFTPASQWVNEFELPDGSHEGVLLPYMQASETTSDEFIALALHWDPASGRIYGCSGSDYSCNFHEASTSTQVQSDRQTLWKLTITSQAWKNWWTQRRMLPGDEAYDMHFQGDRGLMSISNLAAAEHVDLAISKTVSGPREQLLTGVRLLYSEVRTFRPAGAAWSHAPCQGELTLAIQPEERDWLQRARTSNYLFITPLPAGTTTVRGRLDQEFLAPRVVGEVPANIAYLTSTPAKSP